MRLLIAGLLIFGFSINAMALDPQEKVDQNSQKPIYWGIGAGGITLDTTFEQSLEILGRPVKGPTQNGETLYREGLYIVWNPEPPHKAVYILITNMYLGAMDLPAPFGRVKMGYQFEGYDLTTKGGQSKLANDLLLAAKGTPGDCEKDGLCRIHNEQGYVLFEYRDMVLMVSTEDNSLFRALVVPNKRGN